MMGDGVEADSIRLDSNPVEFGDPDHSQDNFSMPKKQSKNKLPSKVRSKAQLLAEQAVSFAQFAAQVLIVAEQIGIKTKPLHGLSLFQDQQNLLLGIPDLTSSTKAKLMLGNDNFTFAEVAGMILAVCDYLPEWETRQQMAGLHLANHLTDSLNSDIAAMASMATDVGLPKCRRPAKGTIFQFKITLNGSKPPIWRRIQVEDCTLDKFHEHIQTAMGWTNSHLHQFEIFEKRYGDPELLDDGFDDFECMDSTKTFLSDILPKTGKRFAFTYEYDFGDGWEHEVRFEGNKPKEPGTKYPVCLEGDRACPPEDCGGIWGYVDFLEAIRNPKHEEHESMLKWIGGRFDPEEFDAKKATKAMKKGLPDWRTMDDKF
jgi:hypothetical protein